MNDELVIQIVNKHLQELEAENKNFILEGFPKTRLQGLALQKAGIIPNSFIILNQNPQNIQRNTLEKISNSDGYYSHIQEDSRLTFAENYALEYQLLLFYTKFIILLDNHSFQ